MRVRASRFIEPGQLLVMADLEHPEVSTAYVLDGETPMAGVPMGVGLTLVAFRARGVLGKGAGA